MLIWVSRSLIILLTIGLGLLLNPNIGLGLIISASVVVLSIGLSKINDGLVTLALLAMIAVNVLINILISPEFALPWSVIGIVVITTLLVELLLSSSQTAAFGDVLTFAGTLLIIISWQYFPGSTPPPSPLLTVSYDIIAQPQTSVHWWPWVVNNRTAEPIAATDYLQPPKLEPAIKSALSLPISTTKPMQSSLLPKIAREYKAPATTTRSLAVPAPKLRDDHPQRPKIAGKPEPNTEATEERTPQSTMGQQEEKPCTIAGNGSSNQCPTPIAESRDNAAPPAVEAAAQPCDLTEFRRSTTQHLLPYIIMAIMCLIVV